MKQFPNMRHPSGGQSKCWNLVVIMWPASFRPWTWSMSNRKLCCRRELKKECVMFF